MATPIYLDAAPLPGMANINLIQAEINRAVWHAGQTLETARRAATLANIESHCRRQRLADDTHRAMVRLSEATAAARLL